MRKEDYELIATVLRETRPVNREHEQEVWKPIMEGMADMLENGDSEFNYDTFNTIVWGDKMRKEDYVYNAIHTKQYYQCEDILLAQDWVWSVANLYMGKHIILHVSYMKDSNDHRSILLRPDIDGIKKSDPIRVVRYLSRMGVDICTDKDGIIYINGLPLE